MAARFKVSGRNAREEIILLDSDSDNEIQFVGVHNPNKPQERNHNLINPDDIARRLQGISFNSHSSRNYQEPEPIEIGSRGFSTPEHQPRKGRAESSPVVFGRFSLDRDDDTILLMSATPAGMRVRNKADMDPVICKQRRLLADSLIEKYGSEQSGWGVKVDSKTAFGHDIIGAIWVAICPVLDNGALFVLSTGSSTSSAIHCSNFHHFPPYRVKLEYISARDNLFTIQVNCLWLGRDHLKTLNAEIQRIVSRANPVENPLDAALNFVERASVPFLGIVDSNNTILCLPSDRQNKSVRCIQFGDPTFVQKTFQDINSLRATLVPLGATTAFECDICYSHAPSETAVIFRECKHYFCRPCVKQAFEMKIADKAVTEFTCLAEKCSTVAGQDLIKEMLDGENFRLYCDITTDFLLDSEDSKQFIRCPQKECNVAMEIFTGPGYNEHPIRCLTCRHVFCVMCKRPPHPGKPCLSDDEKRQIREQCKKADELGKKILEKKYGAENIKFALEDAESEEWIMGNSKPCPVCKTPIQKNEGCNKIVCTAKGCRTFFCWICLKNLADLKNPYEHFSTGQCGGKLWEGVNVNAGLAPGFHAQQQPGFIVRGRLPRPPNQGVVDWLNGPRPFMVPPRFNRRLIGPPFQNRPAIQVPQPHAAPVRPDPYNVIAVAQNLQVRARVARERLRPKDRQRPAPH